MLHLLSFQSLIKPNHGPRHYSFLLFTEAVVSVSHKPKRRPYLLKRKALTTGIFDTTRGKDDKDKGWYLWLGLYLYISWFLHETQPFDMCFIYTYDIPTCKIYYVVISGSRFHMLNWSGIFQTLDSFQRRAALQFLCASFCTWQINITNYFPSIFFLYTHHYTCHHFFLVFSSYEYFRICPLLVQNLILANVRVHIWHERVQETLLVSVNYKQHLAVSCFFEYRSINCRDQRNICNVRN